jgi:hypothetical protein
VNNIFTLRWLYLLLLWYCLMSRVAQSVQCLATGWTTGRSRFDPWQRRRIFLLASVSRPALGPTQPPVQWVPRVLSPGLKCGRDVTLTTHPHLVQRSRMCRNYTFFPPKLLVACSGTVLAVSHTLLCFISVALYRLLCDAFLSCRGWHLLCMFSDFDDTVRLSDLLAA